MTQKRRVPMSITLGILVSIVAGWLLGTAHGQPVEARSGAPSTPAQVPGASRGFGTASELVRTVHHMEFDSAQSTHTWGGASLVTPANGGSGFVRQTDGFFMFAGVQLPAGAQVTRIEFDGCDTSATGEAAFRLHRQPSPIFGEPSMELAAGTTGVTETPGCALFSADIDPAVRLLPIDNATHLYTVSVVTGDSSVWFAAVRVFYRLQISAAPASATFGDVPPSHLFFRFIEALVDAGITAGCGGGNYCPDDPVTRGQMAVFISRALGLHFAP